MKTSNWAIKVCFLGIVVGCGGGTDTASGLTAVTPGEMNSASSYSGYQKLALWFKADSLTQSEGAAISTWTDESGNSNNGSALGGGTPTLSRSSNGAYVKFTASNQNLTVTNNSTLNHDGSYTAFAVINFSSDTYLNGQGVIVKSDYGSFGPTQYQLQSDSSGPRFYTIAGGNGARGTTCGAFYVPQKTLMLIALQVTYDSTLNITTVAYYKNGAGYGGSTAQTKTYNAASNLTVGAQVSTNLDLYELAVFKTALTDSERKLVECSLVKKYGITYAGSSGC